MSEARTAGAVAEVDLQAVERASEGAIDPAAAEISEIISTPPPALVRALLYSFAGLLAALTAWAYVSRYDVILSEPGLLEPAAPAGVIQTDRGARLLSIAAREGDIVAAGQPVFEVVPLGAEGRATLVAPVAGTLAGTADRQIGELLAPGQKLAQIAPRESDYVARIMIANQDVGRLQVGMLVKIKVDAFPYQQYGAMEGKLAFVSAVPAAPQASGPEGSAAGTLPGPPPFEGLVRIEPGELERHRMEPRSGLTLTAEIVVQRRRILDLLLDRLGAT